MSKYVIVTADDFGLHESVNEAVEQSSRAGVLNAASLMVTAPAALDAVTRARHLPNLRVGLHIVLADGQAALDPKSIPSLADSMGHMTGDMALKSWRMFSNPCVRRQLEAEIRAQFAAFAATGLRLDHVNTHKHFHLHPTVLEVLLRVGRDYGAPPMRVPDEPWWYVIRGGNIGATASKSALAPLVKYIKYRLRTAGVFHNDCIFGITGSGGMDEATLLAIVPRLRPGVSEIYLHPATESGRAIAPSMANYRHADELRALLSTRVSTAFRAGAVCGGYADLQVIAGR
jgi:hopanoid biosynthesis associated protein HpnK